jgi:lysophospholipase L1-like esterase
MVAPLSTSSQPDELDVAVYGTDQAVYFKRWEPNHWVPSQTGWDAFTSVPDSSVDTTPFWSGNSMQRESVMMIDRGNGPASRLLATPQNIVSVSVGDLRGSVTYRPRIDWTYDTPSNQLQLLRGSAAPWVTQQDLVNMAANPNEGHFYHDKQLAVTYTHAALPSALVAMAGRSNVAHTRAQLVSHTPTRVILYGDSISAGFNASGVVGAPPYRPSWGQQLVNRLSSAYGTAVTLENPSLPRQTSDWGLRNVPDLVTSHNPDLVIVAFGMNPDSGTNPACTFEGNIRGIVDNIHGATTADVVLVAPMLPNPGGGATLADRLAYRDAVRRVANATNSAFVDMTQVHQILLGWSASLTACEVNGTCSCHDAVALAGTDVQAGPKTYEDQTGNDKNHPNDWLIRWYAQEVGALLEP